MHAATADPDTPNLGIWAAGQQAVRRSQRIFSRFERTGLHIDGDDLALVTCLDLRTHLLFVDRRTTPGVFLFTQTRLPYSHSLLFPAASHDSKDLVLILPCRLFPRRKARPGSRRGPPTPCAERHGRAEEPSRVAGPMYLAAVKKAADDLCGP